MDEQYLQDFVYPTKYEVELLGLFSPLFQHFRRRRSSSSSDTVKGLVQARVPTQVTNETLLSTALEFKIPTETIKYLIKKGATLRVPKESTESTLYEMTLALSLSNTI